jgi:hypothetical protein
MSLQHLLIIEDGSEYTEFARLFLQLDFVIHQAQSARKTLEALLRIQMAALLIDLRFDRAPAEVLLGDVAVTAVRLFGGNQGRALRYLQDQQGVLILAEVRRHGYRQPALFIHDFPARRLANLRKLYGEVSAVPTFDAAAIRGMLRKGA